jgi:phospholipid N-methyltransferase
MPSSGILRRVAIVRTDVSEEHIAFIIRFTRIGELGTKLAATFFLSSVRQLLVTPKVVPSSAILVTLMLETIRTSETSVLTIGTRRNIPEDAILYSTRRENLKSYIITVKFESNTEQNFTANGRIAEFNMLERVVYTITRGHYGYIFRSL